MSERSCGGCTACCKVFPILSIRKPGGVWCRDCHVGHGCRIYEVRPADCKDYTCLWLKGLGTDEDRPDKRKVLVEHARVSAIGGVYTTILWEVSVGGLSGPYVEKMASKCRQQLKPYAFVYLTKRQRVFLPVSFPITPEVRVNLQKDNVELEVYHSAAA